MMQLDSRNRKCVARPVIASTHLHLLSFTNTRRFGPFPTCPLTNSTEGETLMNVSSTPYLGVCLSETLEWEAHINRITSKANSTLVSASGLPSASEEPELKACPPKLRETAYFSLVRSSLEYSSAVWDPFRQKDIDKLEKNQRSTARFVTQNYRQTASVTSLLQNLGWTDLKTRRKNSRLVSMFKI